MENPWLERSFLVSARMRRAASPIGGKRRSSLVAIRGQKPNQSYIGQRDKGQKADHGDVEKGHAASPRNSPLRASMICCSVLLRLAQQSFSNLTTVAVGIGRALLL